MFVRASLHILAAAYLWTFSTGFVGMPVHPVSVETDPDDLVREKSVVYRIEPEKRGGEAFKLVYLAPAPVAVFWRFKTDFGATFLLTNRYIKEHRLISAAGNHFVTENSYTNAPGNTFRWRTTTHPRQHRLTFRLENPHECGQKFHYGTIQLEPFGAQTKVTHIAYFDFFGAYVWANMPFAGGMRSFLRYTAAWEREMIQHLGDQYGGSSQN